MQKHHSISIVTMRRIGIQYVKDVLNCKQTKFDNIENYDFLIFDDVNLTVENIRSKDQKYGLCKTVAGFSWKWRTKQKKKPKDTME